MRLRLLLLGACLALGGCDAGDGCVNEVAGRFASPDGARQAVLFQRDCGATTGFSTQVSILAPGGEPVGGGDAFIADDDHGAAERGSWGGPLVQVRWTGPDRLEIAYAERARIFRREARVAGVLVSYRTLAASDRLHRPPPG